MCIISISAIPNPLVRNEAYNFFPGSCHKIWALLPSRQFLSWKAHGAEGGPDGGCHHQDSWWLELTRVDQRESRSMKEPLASFWRLHLRSRRAGSAAGCDSGHKRLLLHRGKGCSYHEVAKSPLEAKQEDSQRPWQAPQCWQIRVSQDATLSTIKQIIKK